MHIHRWWAVFGVIGTVLAAFSPSSLAQQAAWRIPRLGAVEYRRTWKGRASPACPSAAAARKAAADQSLPARYLHGLPPAPFLCQSELRRDQRAIEGAVADLRDVMRTVAFDLSGRSAKARFARLLPFGDISVRGSWSAPQQDGKQTLVAKLSGKAAKRLGGETPLQLRRLRAFCMGNSAGTLRIERCVDAARGLVISYSGRFDLVVDERERRWRRLDVRDQWQLVAVRDNQDFDFRKRTANAIRDGAGWLRAAIAADKSFLIDRRGERNYGSGRLALALMTLLHAHVPAADDIVQRGFSALRKRRLDDAYSLATSLMAMAALHRREALDARGLKVAGRWLAKMLQCVDTRTDTAELLRFNYQKGARYDTSLQQYGLLGMRAAQDLGLPLPRNAFAAAAQHLLAVQGAPTGNLSLVTVGHDQLLASLGDARPPKGTTVRARIRGFAYQDPGEPPFGSMTSAGVSGLLLARAGLSKQPHAVAGTLRKRIDASVRDGFAWLAQNFSVRLNPGYAERADNHWAYWLYCLERCCELDGIARLQGRDWYYEGGLQLLAAQNPNGSFRSGHSSTLQLDSTCFAILFLAKASAPVPITGR